METTNYVGINYAGKLSTANKDTTAGIRYGVIPQNEVLQSWADSSEPVYPNTCPYCGNEPKSGKAIVEMKRCPSCYKKLEESDFYDQEAMGFTLDDGEYIAECDNYGDIFIIKSPYYTYAQFCSPCAPGACYLLNPLESPIEDNKCYCFGQDWFDNEKAPYPIYSIKTGKIVEKE